MAKNENVKNNKNSTTNVTKSASGFVRKVHPSGNVEEYNPFTTETTSSFAKKQPYSRTDYRTSVGGVGYYGEDGLTASQKNEIYFESHRYSYSEAEISFYDLEQDNRQKLLKKHKKSRTIQGKTYYCFIDRKTNKEEWFYCPPSKKIQLKTDDGMFQQEYISLSYAPSQAIDSHIMFLDEMDFVSPYVISSKGFEQTDVVGLYKVDIDHMENGRPSPIINYDEFYLAHASEDFAESPILANPYLCYAHGCQISDDGKYFRTGVADQICKNPDEYSFSEYEIEGLEVTRNTSDLSKYTVRDLAQERELAKKEIERAKYLSEHYKKEKIENDPKIDYLRKNFPCKQMRGRPEFFLIENPKTKEKKWYYCPQATYFMEIDPKTKQKEEHVSIGGISADLLTDDGKVIMSCDTYRSTDIVMLYEVDIEKNKQPAIQRDKYYVVHLETMDMVECYGYAKSFISEDGEKMKIRNPNNAALTYDLVSTRTSDVLETNVSAP